MIIYCKNLRPTRLATDELAALECLLPRGQDLSGGIFVIFGMAAAKTHLGGKESRPVLTPTT